MTAAARDPWPRLRLAALASLVVLAVAVVALIVVRKSELKKERRRLSDQQSQGPLVQVARVRRSPPRRALRLIGEARPFSEVTLYAKVSGYLRHVAADKGDRVRRGQLLAVIESPETDRDYQAAVANARNLRAVARRYEPLLRKRFVSQQEADQAFANADVAEAQAGALKVLKGYEELRAPFEGIVTARYADEGALVQNAQNGAAGALPVFTVSDADKLRVFVYVDQADAPSVRVGAPARLSLVERPDDQVEGRVTRLAGALDDRTRTLLTEIDIDNSRRSFVPGSFLLASLDLPAPQYLTIPSEAVIMRSTQPFTAVIGRDDRLTLRRIALGGNDGVDAQVVSGLSEGERVALNVGESIAEGTRVRLGTQPAGLSGYGSGGKGGQGPQAGEKEGPGQEPGGEKGGREKKERSPKEQLKKNQKQEKEKAT